ncbi:DNA polymerase III subunit delta [Novosphingobium acidiphilum]|uniref:DNA polymerase III subunit delta n=1 Tax=Novosphingobium acidiphilum TaxID=505248 RepID=UPI00041730F8|nr:DNA polymerase III subunit delta [Novosphingobium acidiphilum]
MKATQKTFAGMLGRVLQQARVFYFCGADEAGAADAAALVAARLGAAERQDFTGADLKRDPIRLADEARSTSLFGDKRLIVVTMSGDEAYEAIATLIADPVAGWPVLVIASGATDKSRVAKLLADRDDALVSVFYPPDLRSASEAVRTMADAAGVRLGGAMVETIALAAGLDTRIVRSEIDKLALYLDASPESPRTATPADLAAIGTATIDDSMGPLVNAALGGMVDRLGDELGRLASGDINPVGLLLAFERRAVQLAQLAARAGTGGNLNGFLDAEIQARRVFFRDKPDLMVQLHKWRGAKLERLLNRLALLHRALLSDSNSAQLRMRQAIVEITRVSAR